jgi:hypothetical protein
MRGHMLIQRKSTKCTWERNGVCGGNVEMVDISEIVCLSVFILYERARSLNHRLLQWVKL